MSDLISRQAAIEAIYQALRKPSNSELFMRISNAIKELPPAQGWTPVRHGKWISVPNKKARICSTCESDEPYKFADEDANVFDYCPHCGTKMDAKEVWIY